jgi:DNA-binding LytR/AlgR family response regulator
MNAHERLRILAVDDERPAREDLVQMLSGLPRVGLAAAAASAADALVALSEDPPFDGVFLDVRMPGLDGVELGRILRRFERPPALVFVSAYDRFAVDAFALAALDYLVKPVSRSRLEEAVERVARSVGAASTLPGPELDAPVLSVDALTGGGTRLLERESIFYLQANGDYVRVIAEDGHYLLRARLAEVEERWGAYGFVRVHRAFVINLRRAVEVRPQLNGTAIVLMRDGSEVPIARRQTSELRRRLSL